MKNPLHYALLVHVITVLLPMNLSAKFLPRRHLLQVCLSCRITVWRLIKLTGSDPLETRAACDPRQDFQMALERDSAGIELRCQHI